MIVMKAIDLFAGAGGLSLGLHLAGIDIVGAVEIDSHACETYRHNLGDHIFEKDITSFPPKEMEELMKSENLINSKKDIDLVAGGPPCPGFSNIGRSKISSLIKEGKWSGSEIRHSFIEDPRNKLFHQFVKYVKYFQPSVFLMENVSGMTSYRSSDNKPIIEVIRNEFENINYNVKIEMLTASDFGVPQSRKRIFFMGWRNDYNEPFFPVAKGFEITSMEAICDIPESWHHSDQMHESSLLSLKKSSEILSLKGERKLTPEGRKFLKEMRNRKPPKNGDLKRQKINLHRSRVVNPRDVGVFPEIKSGEFGIKKMFKDIDPSIITYPDNWRWNKSTGTIWNGRHGQYRRDYRWYNPGTFGDKMRRIRGDKPAPTIVAHLTHDGYMFIHPDLHRTITVREAARFQSFPDKFDFSANGKVPWSKQFKQVGNAVPPLLAKELGLSIMKSIH